MQIYLARNQVQAGPYTLTELNNMLATGQVELGDLMWHAGMEQWKPVGEMTQGQFHYNPNASVSPNTPPRRVSVAELYGKKEPESDLKQVIDLSKSTPASAHNKTLKAQPFNNTTDELATISNRVLAVIIDSLLLMACYLPFLSGLNYDFDKITATAGDMDKMTQLTQSVPEHLSSMSSLMFLALFAVQLVLLLRKGQTIGKLVTGIRIVDVQSRRLASATNIILWRSLVTSALYVLPMVGPIILIADFVIMVTNKQRRSLHDKFAKTMVVKAKPDQLKK
ncbi:RDD family protein [Psychrobacter sanguinis]|uniref:RDD family protein n=1 Tax=Psychrobacter sanguinis TaxID=861445 RepID=UPI0028A017A9|nr:RDD family protein [Psychrobacter sanguinis]